MDNSEVEADFFNALALLHSTDDDSAEKLRKLLDASIERKYGPSKTLAVRMPSETLPDAKNRQEESRCSVDQSSLHGGVYGQWNMERLARSPTRRKLEPRGRANFAMVQSIEAIISTDFTNAIEKGEIPRISIPDEGSSASDGALCKICNGAKLGPLILLECQECLDVYHPLCHHPPALDIDIYDPRLVWRCGKCIETSEVPLPTKSDDQSSKGKMEKRARMTNPGKDRSRAKETKKLNYFGRNKMKLCDRDNAAGDSNRSPALTTSGIMREPLKKFQPASSCTFQKTLPSSFAASGAHLRKRVGSKITVTRAPAK